MSSGMKKLVVNTQERAVSTDINRLQEFKTTDIMEMLRYLVDVAGNDDVSAGVITEPNTITTPLTADIIGGLLVKPQIASLNILVDPGVMGVVAPDGAADESNYKYIRDAGVLAAGVLVMTANASGFTRIDVIECRINPIDLLVTDNRDIFDPTSGLFTATSVTKERSGRLEYRVRAGTPGAGYPAAVSGWLPLAVASVPTGTVTNDTVTFWDVRPLVSERAFQPANMTSTVSRVFSGGMYSMDDTTAPGELRMHGAIEATCAGYRAGGTIRSTVPGTDLAYVNLLSATNQAAGFAFPVSGLYYVYYLFPFGLPRWARYTDFGSGSRRPRNPRGIIVVSDVVPTNVGTPSAPINLPASTGFSTGSTNVGVLICAGESTSSPWPVVFDGKTCWYQRAITVAAAGTWATSLVYTLIVGTHFPSVSRALHFNLRLLTASITADSISFWGGLIDVAKGADTYISGYSIGSGTNTITSRNAANTGAQFFKTPVVKIPIPTNYPTLTGSNIVVTWATSGGTAGGGGSFADNGLEVRGFDLC